LYKKLKERRVTFLYIPLFFYWIVLFIATTIPAPALPDILDFSDKIKHFIAYLGFAFLLSLSLHFQEKYKKFTRYFFIYAMIVVALYGAIDEIHQIFVPNRMCEFWDWVADVLGGLVGVSFSIMFLKRYIPVKIFRN